MSEKQAKKERKKMAGNLTVITAHIYRTPQGMNAIVQGIPGNFDYAMACAGLINKTISSHFVQQAGLHGIPPAANVIPMAAKQPTSKIAPPQQAPTNTRPSS